MFFQSITNFNCTGIILHDPIILLTISVHPSRSMNKLLLKTKILMFLLPFFRLTVTGWTASVYSQFPAVFTAKRVVFHKDLKKKNPANTCVYWISSAPRVGLEPTTTRLTAVRSTDWAIEEYSVFLHFFFGVRPCQCSTDWAIEDHSLPCTFKTTHQHKPFHELKVKPSTY